MASVGTKRARAEGDESTSESSLTDWGAQLTHAVGASDMPAYVQLCSQLSTWAAYPEQYPTLLGGATGQPAASSAYVSMLEILAGVPAYSGEMDMSDAAHTAVWDAASNITAFFAEALDSDGVTTPAEAAGHGALARAIADGASMDVLAGLCATAYAWERHAPLGSLTATSQLAAAPALAAASSVYNVCAMLEKMSDVDPAACATALALRPALLSVLATRSVLSPCNDCAAYATQVMAENVLQAEPEQVRSLCALQVGAALPAGLHLPAGVQKSDELPVLLLAGLLPWRAPKSEPGAVEQGEAAMSLLAALRVVAEDSVGAEALLAAEAVPLLASCVKARGWARHGALRVLGALTRAAPAIASVALVHAGLLAPCLAVLEGKPRKHTTKRHGAEAWQAEQAAACTVLGACALYLPRDCDAWLRYLAAWSAQLGAVQALLEMRKEVASAVAVAEASVQRDEYAGELALLAARMEAGLPQLRAVDSVIVVLALDGLPAIRKQLFKTAHLLGTSLSAAALSLAEEAAYLQPSQEAGSAERPANEHAARLLALAQGLTTLLTDGQD